MSTPKKIRASYEITFKRLVSTSPTTKKLRQFLSSLRNPVQSFNLPITLEDVKNKLLSPLKLAKKPSRKKSAKTTVKKSGKDRKARKK